MIGKILQAIGVCLVGLGLFVSIGQGGNEKLLLTYSLAGMFPFALGWLLVRDKE